MDSPSLCDPLVLPKFMYVHKTWPRFHPLHLHEEIFQMFQRTLLVFEATCRGGCCQVTTDTIMYRNMSFLTKLVVSMERWRDQLAESSHLYQERKIPNHFRIKP